MSTFVVNIIFSGKNVCNLECLGVNFLCLLDMTHLPLKLCNNRGFKIFFLQAAAEGRSGGCDHKRPLSAREVWGMLPQKNLKFRSSEMQFPAFWASKKGLFMIIFLDQ